MNALTNALNLIADNLLTVSLTTIFIALAYYIGITKGKMSKIIDLLQGATIMIQRPPQPNEPPRRRPIPPQPTTPPRRTEEPEKKEPEPEPEKKKRELPRPDIDLKIDKKKGIQATIIITILITAILSFIAATHHTRMEKEMKQGDITTGIDPQEVQQHLENAGKAKKARNTYVALALVTTAITAGLVILNFWIKLKENKKKMREKGRGINPDPATDTTIPPKR